MAYYFLLPTIPAPRSLAAAPGPLFIPSILSVGRRSGKLMQGPCIVEAYIVGSKLAVIYSAIVVRKI
jgi:hypothetical protein